MNESQWNYLGLTHNPFSDPQKEFFPGADREQLLGKVRKLSQWSRPILTVSGPHGVGKTCVFRALSSSLESGVVAARVNGSLVSRAGDVLSALVQGYGVATPAGADAPLLIELIIAHLADQSQKQRTSLVLVDDAHLLEQRAVDDLVNLVDAGAKLAFFSEPQFVESLQRAIERNAETKDDEELLWQEMLLSPFSRDQSGDYLAWRFAEAGYEGRTPFSEHQIDIIHRTSEGYPGRLDFAANEQLMLMTVGGAPSVGMPRKHLWLAGGLACVLGLVLWLWSPSEDPEVDKKTVELEMPDASDATDTLEPELATPAPRLDQKPVVADASSGGSGSSAAPELPLSRTVEPIPSAERVDAEPVVSTSRTVRPEPIVTEPEPVVAEIETVPVEPPKPAPQPEPTPEAIIVDAGGVRDAGWLLAQNDASYTIQLIGFGEEERAKSYLSQQDRPEQFALFRTQSGSRLVHVVTFGVYGTQAAAEAAAAALPSSVGKINPWVRPIRSVKSAIGTASQGN